MATKSDDVLLNKFRKILRMTARIRISRVAKSLALSEEDLFEKLLDWVDLLSFKIDDECIVGGTGLNTEIAEVKNDDIKKEENIDNEIKGLHASLEKIVQADINEGGLIYGELKSKISSIPFEKILDKDQIECFLDNRPVLFFEDDNQRRTIPAISVISMYLSTLELDPDDSVLILGAKGGILEGIVASIAKKVIIVEQYHPIADFTSLWVKKMGIDNVQIINRNPLLGAPEYAPFNKIFVTGAIEEENTIPKRLFDQLSLFGLLVAPVGVESQRIYQFVKERQKTTVNNYGNSEIVVSPLLFDPIPNEATIEVSPIPDNQKSSTEVISNIASITFEEVNFENERKNTALDPDATTYVLKVVLRNNSSKDLILKLKAEMPSVHQDHIPEKFEMKKNSTSEETILMTNPNREGDHLFKIIVLNDDDLRISFLHGKVIIKKPTWKRILEFGLSFIGGKVGAILSQQIEQVLQKK